MGKTECAGSVTKQNAFDLNCVYVVEVTSDRARWYSLMMLNYFEQDGDKITSVLCGREAERAMRSYESEGHRYSVRSASCYLDDEIREKYNKALDDGEFDFCASILFDLSLTLNNIFGYEKGRQKVHNICGK